VFTAERLAALEMLAAQAAISLENAQLLERERAGRIEAEAAKHRELLLGEATTLMTQTLDYQGVLAALARLCARSFADWAGIDLEEHGEIVRIAAAHREPAKEALLHEMTARYALRPGSATPIWHVLRTGEVLELPSITDEQIRAMCIDDHHADLIQRLGTRSSVIVPLRARDKVIGALGLTSATPHRFGRADVELAAELGRRASLAIDNARLIGEMRRALSLREEFLRIASHELRTPLASLRLTAQALMRAAERKRAVPPEFLDASLRRVLDNTRRLDQLTSELLDVTRIENGRLQLAPADVALDAIVREAVGRLEAELAAAGSPVSIECAAPIYGWWDPSRLEQVVTNLVGNAAKFGSGQPIEVKLEERGDEARLTVIDHGIGIDPARRAHIFDRFERAVPSSSYGGLGLGLYIARSLVIAHGGTITVESEPGAGATFTVTLPCEAHARTRPASGEA
jgi:signal transduction histidine kinase